VNHQMKWILNLQDADNELEQTGFGDKLNSIIDEILSAHYFAFVFFYADWCHFCSVEKPIISELKQLYSDHIVFIFVNEAINAGSLECI